MAFWHNSELPRCKGRIDSIALTLYAPALCIYVNAYSPPSEASATRTHTHVHTHARSVSRRAPLPSPTPRRSYRGEARRDAAGPPSLVVCNRPMASSCTNYTRSSTEIYYTHARSNTYEFSGSLLSSPLHPVLPLRSTHTRLNTCVCVEFAYAYVRRV